MSQIFQTFRRFQMYQKPNKQKNIRPMTRNEAIIDIVGKFTVNWPRFDNATWPPQMQKLLLGTFKTTHPDSIIKAGWHVLQKVDGDYPPSMGKIVKSMEAYIGSGAARSPKAEQCEKCNAGFILVSFWMILDDTSYKQDVQCACDCAYGKKRQASIKSIPFRDFIALNTQQPKRYIANRFETWQKDLGLWVQGETYIIDEIPTHDEHTVRNCSKDLPPVAYYELGLDDAAKKRRAQLRQTLAETEVQKTERLHNIGIEMQKAIKQLAKKMSIPVPNDFEQLEHQDDDNDDDSISDDSTEDMPKTVFDQPQQTQNDIQNKSFDDEIDWHWHT